MKTKRKNLLLRYVMNDDVSEETYSCRKLQIWLLLHYKNVFSLLFADMDEDIFV